MPPAALAAIGAVPLRVQPLGGYVSLLTVNRDPGAGRALAGGGCLAAGVLLALFSFYRKRRAATGRWCKSWAGRRRAGRLTQVMVRGLMQR